MRARGPRLTSMLHARTVGLKRIHDARCVALERPLQSSPLSTGARIATEAVDRAMSASRRLHERFDVELPVVILHDGVEIPAATINLSLGGMLIKTERRIAFGANVLIRMELPALKEPAEIAAVVRWDRDGQVGVQFSALRAKDTWALNQLMKR